MSVTLLPGAERIAGVHGEAGAQPDNLCGPYWVSTLLRATGIAHAGDVPITPERAALASGTVVPAGGDPVSWLPSGETSRADYGVPIPTTGDPEATGTSVPGMLAAVEELSSGASRMLPVRGFRGGGFDAGSVDRLLAVCLAHPEWEATPILNVRFGRLWEPHVGPVAALAYLTGADIDAPPAEWDVGHFTTLAGLVRGTARSLVLLRDTYPSFGWGGYHVQPPEIVAAALRRDDGREGGCLIFLASADLPEAEREFEEEGFEVGAWDNGTPYDQGA